MSTKEDCFINFSKASLLFCLVCGLYSYSQTKTAVTDQLAENLQKLTQNISADLVYIQTSKSIYETEEDVWFKGYVLDGQYFVDSKRSKILFVQLIEDKTGKVVWEKKYEIENGFVNGHLFLENSLAEGEYTLAGYSSHSFFKEPKEFYALKKISIVKTINNKEKQISVEKDSIVHFSTFPEGGKLISGIQSKLAFKAVNSKGLPVDVSGILFENDIPLQNFKSTYAGMGAVLFTPDSNKKYHIELTQPVRAETFAIAPVEINGTALSLVTNSTEALLFKVVQSDALNDEKVYIRLQVRGVVYSIGMASLKKELLIKIPLKEVPQGIAEVTLFNKDLLPLAERLVYVNQDQNLTIKTALDKSNYSNREQVNLKVKVTDQNEKAVVAHLGLSIYDGLYQNKQDTQNIQSHFLLTAQLKGTVYNPAYYFEQENKDRKRVLDLLMLTQGWRNYVWSEDNLKDQENSQIPVVSDELQGKVALEKPDKRASIVPGQKGIFVFAADDRRGKDVIMTDSAGSFTIGPDYLKKGENSYTYLQLMTPAEPKYRMHIKDFSFEAINKQRKNKMIIYPLPEIEKEFVEASTPFTGREAINKLNEVLIAKKTKKVFRDKYIGKLDSLAKLNGDYICSLNVLNCPNLAKHGGETTKPVEGKEYKVFSGAGTTKIIYHYTNYTEAQLLEMFNIVTVESYYGKKMFYEPVYDNVTITDPLPDYRNTLFWKPDIITNEKGEANITFFCSDINSEFIGNIEGVSGDGLLGAGRFKFAVKK